MDTTFEFRHPGIEDVDKLLWVTTDKGAWSGPLMDWKSDHKAFMENVTDYRTVVQAGGNCGMYARFYGNYFEKVISFEPEPSNYHCLVENCQGDKYDLYQGAVGNTNDKLSLSRCRPTNVGEFKILGQPGEVQMYRIDDLNLDNCGLIHLDIEGYEGEALRGAAETIKKFAPVVITERSNGHEFLATLGYRALKSLRMDTIFIKSS